MYVILSNRRYKCLEYLSGNIAQNHNMVAFELKVPEGWTGGRAVPYSGLFSFCCTCQTKQLNDSWVSYRKKKWLQIVTKA